MQAYLHKRFSAIALTPPFHIYDFENKHGISLLTREYDLDRLCFLESSWLVRFSS